MKYINIDDMNAIDIASKVIQDGGLIAYPTDTLYGLGGDARNAQAIKNINLIKNRKTPISVIVWSLEVAASWALISKKEFDEASTYIKESSTVILPVKNHIVHRSILADDGTLGLRMPHCDFPIALCAKLGFPITTTSINRTGQPPLSDPKLIKEQFDSEIDLIIDAGIIPNGKASTIYKLTNSKFSIIRS